MSHLKKVIVMDNLNLQMFYHLDDLRVEAGISINDFCEGVVDRRTYSRYINGETNVSLKNITLFYEKLGYSQIEFYNSFYWGENSTYAKVVKLDHALSRKDFDAAREYFKELENVEMHGKRTKDFYQFCIISYNFLTRKDLPEQTIEKLSKLINYPACFSKSRFNYVDIASIVLLSKLEFKKKEYRGLEFMYSLLFNRKMMYLTSETRKVLPSIFDNVSMMYGVLKEIEKALEVSEEGIRYCLFEHTTFALENLYYYSGLCYHKLGNPKLRDDRIMKSMMVMISMGYYSYFNKMIEVMKRDFGFDPRELFLHKKIETDMFE